MAIWDWEEMNPKWSFVVDTDSYAGNFERELSSYVVGKCDEHGGHRGGAYRAMYEETFWRTDPFENILEYRIVDPGDDGIARAPMDIAPTPGHEKPTYNSVAIFLSRKPSKKELSILVGRSDAFVMLPKIKMWDVRPKILGFRLVEERVEVVSHPVKR